LNGANDGRVPLDIAGVFTRSKRKEQSHHGIHHIHGFLTNVLAMEAVLSHATLLYFRN